MNKTPFELVMVRTMIASEPKPTEAMARLEATVLERDAMRAALKGALPFLSAGTVFGDINKARQDVEIALGMRLP